MDEDVDVQFRISISPDYPSLRGRGGAHEQLIQSMVREARSGRTVGDQDGVDVEQWAPQTSLICIEVGRPGATNQTTDAMKLAAQWGQGEEPDKLAFQTPNPQTRTRRRMYLQHR